MIDLIGLQSGFGGYRFDGFEIMNVEESLGARLVVLEFNVRLRGLSIGLGQFRLTIGCIHSSKVVTPSWSGCDRFHGFGFEIVDNLFSD